MGPSTVLITGAASGIGEATARRLAVDGTAQLVLVDRDADRLDAVTRSLEGVRVFASALDVSDADAWPALEAGVEERFGGLDGVVVNAGIAHGAPITEIAFDDWRRVMAVNLDGAFLTLQSGLRLIRKRGGGGAAVIVASAAGLKAEPGIAAYAASKAAVIQLAKVAAKEGAGERIRVNAIAPGGVETDIWRGAPFFRDLAAQAGSERAAFDQMAAMATPLARFAQADEIAGQIAFLLSDAAAYITGAVLVSDGGYTL